MQGGALPSTLSYHLQPTAHGSPPRYYRATRVLEYCVTTELLEYCVPAGSGWSRCSRTRDSPACMGLRAAGGRL